MTDERPIAGLSALIELRQADMRAGVDPAAPSRVVETAPPGPPPPTAREIVEPVDWEQELAERARQERAQATRAETERAQRELERLGVEPERAPNPGWRAEQMRPA